MHGKFISAKGFELILAQVGTRLLIYVFRSVNYNGLGIINSASILMVSKKGICMANMRPKRYSPNMSLYLDQKDDVWTILLLLHLFERRVRMVSIKGVI